MEQLWSTGAAGAVLLMAITLTRSMVKAWRSQVTLKPVSERWLADQKRDPTQTR